MQDTIIRALKSSGRILLDSFGRIGSIAVKQNQSNVVTEVDIASEKNIVETIQEKFPSHNIIAEETGFKSNNSEYTWIVDPLDGTSNFASGIPSFGIMVAVLRNFEPVMAGIYLPFYDLLYLAEESKGAFRNNQKIEMTDESDLKNVLVSYSLDYSEDFSKTERETEIIGQLVQNVRNLRATNSIVDFCYTADGRLGGCVNQSTKIWDVVAAYLLIKEAGGVMTDINGEDIDFKVDASNYERNFTIVASSKILHPKIMGLIKKVKN